MKGAKALAAIVTLLLPFAVAESPIPCGGHTVKPQVCPRGQSCAPTQPPNIADLSGDCVLKSCGGKTREPGICPDTQVCVYNHTLITDIPGRCMSAKLTCGGRGRGSRRCKDGWQCVMDPDVDFSYKFEGNGICVPPGSLYVDLEGPWTGWGS
jgi:hypothetical protein